MCRANPGRAAGAALTVQPATNALDIARMPFTLALNQPTFIRNAAYFDAQCFCA
jgi:hypothetical protein